jgi:hypothetical protein
MPIRMITHDARTGPVVLCDQCGEAITDANNASVLYRAIDGSETHFVHTGCSRAFQIAKPYTLMRAMGLDVAWVQVAAALHLDFNEAEQRAQQLADL